MLEERGGAEERVEGASAAEKHDGAVRMRALAQDALDGADHVRGEAVRPLEQRDDPLLQCTKTARRIGRAGQALLATDERITKILTL